ncbi:YlxR family protein [Naumannella huperziae]
MSEGPAPTRTCVGCRRRAPQAELCRLAVGAGGAIAIGRTLPGRGAWLHPDPGCLDLARRRRALPRALRVPADGLRVDWGALAARLARPDATVLGPAD